MKGRIRDSLRWRERATLRRIPKTQVLNAAPLELVQGPQARQPGFLDRILCRPSIAQVGHRQPHHRPVVAADQGFEGGLVAGLQGVEVRVDRFSHHAGARIGGAALGPGRQA